MGKLLKIFFVVFLLIACRKNNTSYLSELVNYKGTYLGDEVIFNSFYVDAVVSIDIDDNGDVTVDITLNNENIYFYTDADFIKELSSTKFEVNSAGQYLSLDFSSGLFFIFNQGKGNYSGNLIKQ